MITTLLSFLSIFCLCFPNQINSESLFSLPNFRPYVRQSKVATYTNVHNEEILQELDTHHLIVINEKQYYSFGWVIVSNICGIVYVAAWMGSYYPQAIMNCKRKRVDGLSHDFAFYNIIGYVCYSIFTCVQFAYQRYHSSANAVEPVDLAFSIHSLVITTFIGIQIIIYPKGKQQMGLVFKMFIGIFILCTIALSISSILGKTPWLTIPSSEVHYSGFIQQIMQTFSFIQYMGYVKSVITFMKYIPQVHLNYSRKSTVGMSSLNYILDFCGGVLSLAQNVIDAINYGDSAYIIGNIPKLTISLSTIIYDSIILFQHYILYSSSFFFKGNKSHDFQILNIKV